MRKPGRLSKRQQQAAQTRSNLLQAGRTVFLEDGFQKATMTRVNKLAETGYGTAYVYFKNKDELFIELMESAMANMYEVAALPFAPQSREEAFRQIKQQVRQFNEAALDERRIMAIVKEAIGVSAAVEEKWNSIRTRFIRGIADDIRHVQESGLADPDYDALLIAKGWYAMNEQLMWDLVLGEIEEDLDTMSHNLARLYTKGLYL